MHELFHCIQPRLGLTTGATAGDDSHLDSLEGRYWMRLEWRALARALGASGAARTSAIADALAFRAARHQRFPGAAAAEHPVEINEGIATYTQYVTGSDSAEDASRHATAALSASETGILGPDVRVCVWSRLRAVARRVVSRLASKDHRGERLWPAALGRGGSDCGAGRAPPLRGMTARRCGRPKSSAIASSRRSSPSCAAAMSMVQCSRAPRGSGSVNNMGATVIPGLARCSAPWRTKAPGDPSTPGRARFSADGQTISLPAPVVVDATTLKGDGWTATVARVDRQPGLRPGSFRVVRQ